MSVEEQEDDYYKQSEICQFYNGKSVFITGASGFLGTLLLEILLRCCPGIVKIYILLRPKNKLTLEDRKEDLFKKEIFQKLIENNPDILDKVVIVPGNITRAYFGMCENDLCEIIHEVSIVFHCAASISLQGPMSILMINNLIGVDNIINICRKIRKLEAFVYTSTLYSNFNRTEEIDEIIYKLPFKATEAVQLLRYGNLKALDYLFSKCKPEFVNYYTFSKCMAENLIAERGHDLPVSIIRPSLILSCFKGALPGYFEDGFVVANLATAIGKGIIHVLQISEDCTIEFIPADFAANTHIIAAFLQATKKTTSPSVYNCTSGTANHRTLKEFIKTLIDLVTKHPLPNCYIIPNVVLCNNASSYKFYSFIYHSIPAAIIDGVLWIIGKEFRLRKSYQLLESLVSNLEHLSKIKFAFRCEKFASISEKLHKTDAEIFDTNMRHFKMKEWASALYTGYPMYRVDDKPYKDTLKACLTRYFVTYSIRFCLLGSIYGICYFAFF